MIFKYLLITIIIGVPLLSKANEELTNKEQVDELYQLANGHYRKGEKEKTLVFFDSIINIYQSNVGEFSTKSDSTMMCNIYLSSAVIATYKGDNLRAKLLAESGGKFLSNHSSVSVLGYRYNNIMGIIHGHGEVYEEALLYFKKSLAIIKKLSNISTQDSLKIEFTMTKALAHTNVGRIFNEATNTKDTVQWYHKRAESILDSVYNEVSSKTKRFTFRYKQIKYYLFSHYGYYYANNKEYLIAIEYYEKALKLGEDLDLSRERSKNLFAIGLIKEKMGQNVKSLEKFQKSLFYHNPIDEVDYIKYLDNPSKRNLIQILITQELEDRMEKEKGHFMIIYVLLLILGIGGISTLIYFNRHKRNQREYELQKRLSEELKKKKEQADFFRREMNHRIKNNLQVAVSTLEVQLYDENIKKSTTATSVIKESILRIYSSLTIHKLLQKNDSETLINLQEYFSDLSCHIKNALGYREDNFHSDIKLENLPEASSEKVARIGMVVAELSINSFKYSPNNRLYLNLSVYSKDNKFNVVVSDKGRESKTNSSKEKDKFGLGAIKQLIEGQFNGEFPPFKINEDGIGRTYSFSIPSEKLS